VPAWFGSVTIAPRVIAAVRSSMRGCSFLARLSQCTADCRGATRAIGVLRGSAVAPGRERGQGHRHRSCILLPNGSALAAGREWWSVMALLMVLTMMMAMVVPAVTIGPEALLILLLPVAIGVWYLSVRRNNRRR
jgi:hypothetical protein